MGEEMRHWADTHYDSLNSKGFNITEKDFNKVTTNGVCIYMARMLVEWFEKNEYGGKVELTRLSTIQGMQHSLAILEELELGTINKHPALNTFVNVTNKGIEISNLNFDSDIKRGELFAMTDKVVSWVEANTKATPEEVKDLTSMFEEQVSKLFEVLAGIKTKSTLSTTEWADGWAKEHVDYLEDRGILLEPRAYVDPLNRSYMVTMFDKVTDWMLGV